MPLDSRYLHKYEDKFAVKYFIFMCGSAPT